MPLRNISELSYYLSTLKEVDQRWRRQKRHLKWRFKIHSKQITEQWCHCLRPIATNTPIISGFKWLTEHASNMITQNNQNNIINNNNNINNNNINNSTITVNFPYSFFQFQALSITMHWELDISMVLNHGYPTRRMSMFSIAILFD